MKIKSKKKLGSFPYGSMVFSITLALFVIGLFGLLILHSNKLKDSIRDNITIQVFLDKSATENDKIRINKLLSQKEYVSKSKDSTPIKFISKEEAAKLFIDNTGEDFIEFLGENPLRDAFSVKIGPNFQDVDNLQKIKDELTNVSSVFEVVYIPSLIESINSNITKISLVLAGFTLILLFAIVILINNTIKLAMFSQRFLIRSMQLVGAKPGFIISPFVRKAGLQGLLSGLIASGILLALRKYVHRAIPELSHLQSNQEIMILFSFIILLGIILGITSTYYAVKKYLKISLDELY